ncbi:MAG: LysR family transcriptional regulator [Gammaproteobacteria bacterium]|nr:LysR family transcriptional regulator [Gammaproteobacteria bacterium]
MRFVQLRAFHHVCLHGGFSSAADALHLTQPAISDQISRLEAEYDLLLFHREGKQVTPTAAGEELLEITHRYFDVHQQAQDFLSERQRVSQGRLRLVADSTRHILDQLALFRSTYPNVSVEISSGNSDAVLRRLRAYEADIGILGMEVSDTAFKSIALESSALVAVVHHQHTLASRKSIRLNTILDQPLVLRETGSRTRALIEAAAKERGKTLQIAIEAEGREAVQELLAAGTGLGIVSAAEIGHDQRLVALPIRDWQIRMAQSLVCLKERQHGKLINAFFELGG